MEQGGALMHSQEPVTCPYPELIHVPNFRIVYKIELHTRESAYHTKSFFYHCMGTDGALPMSKMAGARN